MPRQSRIDAPGAVHHIIARGISQKSIFKDDHDRKNFLERLGAILTETCTPCYAWALIPNHFHLLLRTGSVPVATVMRRLLTGYAVTFNRRHKRWGHLFQNRYKSILCQEDIYLLELVRYIHLNPLRAKIVKDLTGLDHYAFCGHSTLLGYRDVCWQDTESILARFDAPALSARREYRQFIQKGITQGQRPELVGGGLVRSHGGWAAVKALRKSKSYLKGDERVLGESAFVDKVLAKADEKLEKKYKIRARGVDLESVTERVAEVLGVDKATVWSAGKYRKTVEARSLLCYWAVRELGISMAEMSRRLKISSAAVSQSVQRGEKIAIKNEYRLIKQ